MTEPVNPTLPTQCNGPAWASILAGSVGACAFGLCTVLSEASPTAAKLLLWSKPVGSLLGVVGVAIAVWAAAWITLGLLWENRHFDRQAGLLVACGTLIGVAFLATFPPFYDLL